MEITDELLEKAKRILDCLITLYPAPQIPLDHSSTFQLLVAVVLSAQVKDGWSWGGMCLTRARDIKQRPEGERTEKEGTVCTGQWDSGIP